MAILHSYVKLPEGKTICPTKTWGNPRPKMMLYLILKNIISLSVMLIEPTKMEVEHPKKCRLQQPSYNLNQEDGEFTIKKKHL